ncbi:carbon storage regulator [Planctomicrobium piriforme]|uniref:Uncharacterized protein n=1 Tax=Planctomicrobium piriforme TaxID=1576369 RepID=A0A1I3EI18_9PLAN|nr:carbon storage regulator [Planctomicrobium piriforme]SFH98606.1 hypothetical protein SAMN05421753_104232 [Planctomicrobium piriforme]
MLILSRFMDEKVVIVQNGKEIGSVMLVDVRSEHGLNRALLGFASDPEIKFWRQELWDNIQRGEGPKKT